MNDLIQENQAKLEESRVIYPTQWVGTCSKSYLFELDPIEPDEEFALPIFTTRDSPLIILRHFLTDELLYHVWENMMEEAQGQIFYNGRKKLSNGEFNLHDIFVSLATYMRITALQNAPKNNVKHYQPLREAIKEALNHFREISPHNNNIPGIDKISKYLSCFTINSLLFEELSRNFQSGIIRFGRSVAGDEKLLYFTGETVDFRKVPSKPDSKGIWFYELVCKLSKDLPYMLHMKLQTEREDFGGTNSTKDVVSQWGEVVKRDNNTVLLVFDSYYTTNDAIDDLERRGIKYIGGINVIRFKKHLILLNALSPPIQKINDWSAIYNMTTKQLFVGYYSPNRKLGLKYVISNAFERVEGRMRPGFIPVSQHYAIYFGSCDNYNKNLKDRIFCHKTGGNGMSGELGHHHKFAMACVMQNTYNLCRLIYPSRYQGKDFKTFFCDLADELVESAM